VALARVSAMDDHHEWSESEPSNPEGSAGKSAELASDIESLKRAVRARDRVVAVVAHDLRNPLGIVLQTSSLLLRTLGDPNDRRMVQRIFDVATRAKNLVDDLLDVTSIEQGSFSIEKRRVDLSALVLSAVGAQHSLAARASLVLCLDLHPNIPEVEADERRIHEVLENLVANALKFTPPGGSITIGADARPDEARVWVKDTGAGIPEAELPWVFDRFSHARRLNRKGTGLGLGICKAIVEAHGGRIWLESAPGQGTTVFFALPASAPASSVDAKPLPPASVLLVDDSASNLDALEAMLEGSDFRVLRASSGREALALASRESVAVALVDIGMPNMDGIELAARLKALEGCGDVPILFITTDGGDAREIHRAYEAGGADYLVRPLEPNIVRRKVLVFVNLGRRRR